MNAAVVGIGGPGHLAIQYLATGDLPWAARMGAERAVVGGRLGSAEDTKAMLAFSAAHQVKPMIETFPMKDAHKALDPVRAGKARYRAVLAT